MDLLQGSVDQIATYIDVLIVIGQSTSNWGEYYEEFTFPEFEGEYIQEIFTPSTPARNWREAQKMETHKRNMGIGIAKGMGCSHFLHMDSDEYYIPNEFELMRDSIIECNIPSSVCHMYTYYNTPCIRTEGYDNYYVPFIHALKMSTSVGPRYNYPHHVDPTRKVSGVNHSAIMDHPMHHFSYIRKDMKMKLRNSTASVNINKESYLKQILNISPGTHFNGHDIIAVENMFDID